MLERLGLDDRHLAWRAPRTAARPSTSPGWPRSSRRAGWASGDLACGAVAPRDPAAAERPAGRAAAHPPQLLGQARARARAVRRAGLADRRLLDAAHPLQRAMAAASPGALARRPRRAPGDRRLRDADLPRAARRRWPAPSGGSPAAGWAPPGRGSPPRCARTPRSSPSRAPSTPSSWPRCRWWPRSAPRASSPIGCDGRPRARGQGGRRRPARARPGGGVGGARGARPAGRRRRRSPRSRQPAVRNSRGAVVGRLAVATSS